ncbi:hypothetical protein ACFVWT_04130 [Arthrobacter sp. NPDC058288]|uniref:hypothetical protein n=1 Tax=Arthrobacter sp. NPDC058288 TaxID=3346424 RepID=UPI0036F00973
MAKDEARKAAEAASETHKEAHRRRMAEIRQCALCDTYGYLNGRLCYHDPSAEERTARGVAKARAALRGTTQQEEPAYQNNNEGRRP